MFFLQLVFFTSMFILLRGDECLFSHVQSNMFMNKYAFRRIEFLTAYECASECKISSSCMSFSYDKRSRTCHLNSNNSQQANVTYQPDTLFLDIEQWKQSTIDACSSLSCNISSRCQIMRQNRGRCVQEFQGCGSPQIMSGADVESDGHFLHAVAKYTCKSDFQSCGRYTASSVCQSNGEWTTVEVKCKRFRWRNLKVPVEKTFPCGGHSLQSVRIKGTPTKNRLMVFALGRGKNLLFNVGCRFDKFNTVRKVVLNNFVHGRWGKALIPDIPFPFFVKKTFEVNLAFRNGTYQMSVKGGASWYLKDRTSEVTPDLVMISGFLRIDLVEIVQHVKTIAKS